MHVGGPRDKGNLYFPLNFAANLKLLLKNNSLKIQKKKHKYKVDSKKKSVPKFQSKKY